MLYTFSQADYPTDELESIFAQITAHDAVVLWQNGVLLAIKHPHLFTQCPAPCVALKQDISARNLTALLPKNNKVRLISMMDLVELTERYAPQMGI